MKPVIATIALSLLLLTNVVAQQPPKPLPIPIVPVIAEYQFAERYFMQWIDNHSQYATIEAIITTAKPLVAQMILTEIESQHRTYYTNNEAKAQALKREGKQVFVTPIDFKVTDGGVAEMPRFGLGFQDRHKQAILWRFIPTTRPSERGAGLTPRPTALGLQLGLRTLGTMAGEGTAVQIGEQVYEAAPWPQVSNPPYFIAHRGSITEGLDFGWLHVGQETWKVIAAPDALQKGAQWKLVNDLGRERTLHITALEGDEATITETGAETSVVQMKARFTTESFALRSLQFAHGKHAMRITFTPELNLTSAADCKFQIAYERELVAEGAIKPDAKTRQWLWQLQTPDWSKNRPLRSVIELNDKGYTIKFSQDKK